MIPAVIDTNILVSALMTRNPKSPTVRIHYAILDKKILVLHSPEIIAEYEDVLFRNKFSFDRGKVEEIIDFIRIYGREVIPAKPDTEAFPDQDDKVFYCVALAAQDDNAVLVTGNAKHFPPVPFAVTPVEFVERMGL